MLVSQIEMYFHRNITRYHSNDTNQDEIRIKMDDTILFRSGSTEIHPSAFKMISDITEILEGERVNVFVEGHADADGTEEKTGIKCSQKCGYY